MNNGFCISIFITIFLLGGCATPPENQAEKQPAPMAATWAATSQSTTAPLLDNWLTDFNEPRLEALVAEALERNFDLQATASRLRQLEAIASATGADLYPQASLNAGAARSRNGVRGPTGAVDGVTANRFDLTFNVSWELDVWGRLADEQSASMADAQAAAADFAAARLSLAGRTVNAWFDANAARQQLALAEQTFDSFKSAEDIIRRRYENGVSPALDLRLAITQTEAAAANVELRRQQLDGSIRALEILLGRYPGREIPPSGELPDITQPVPAGLPSELLTRRPDLVAAERRLAATDPRVSAAKKAFLPAFSLTASAGQSSDRLENLLDQSFSVWSLAANAVQPIFQGRRLTANLERQQAIAIEALANFGQRVLEAFREVETALAAETFLVDRLDRLRRSSDAADSAEDSAWERYQRGLTTIITVLESQRRAFESRSAVIDAQRERLANRVSLHLALGGSYGDVPPEGPVIKTPIGETRLTTSNEETEHSDFQPAALLEL